MEEQLLLSIGGGSIGGQDNQNAGVTNTLYDGRFSAITWPWLSRITPRVAGKRTTLVMFFSASAAQRACSTICSWNKRKSNAPIENSTNSAIHL